MLGPFGDDALDEDDKASNDNGDNEPGETSNDIMVSITYNVSYDKVVNRNLSSIIIIE